MEATIESGKFFKVGTSAENLVCAILTEKSGNDMNMFNFKYCLLPLYNEEKNYPGTQTI